MLFPDGTNNSCEFHYQRISCIAELRYTSPYTVPHFKSSLAKSRSRSFYGRSLMINCLSTAARINRSRSTAVFPPSLFIPLFLSSSIHSALWRSIRIYHWWFCTQFGVTPGCGFPRPSWEEDTVGGGYRAQPDCEMEQKIGSPIGFWTRGCSVFERIAKWLLCRIPRNPMVRH